MVVMMMMVREQSDVEKLHTIVEGFSPGEIRDMQENVAKVSIFFRYRPSLFKYILEYVYN